MAKGRKRERLALALALAIGLLLAAIVSVFPYLRLVRAPTRTVISEIPPPEKTQLAGPPVFSPDGSAVAYSFGGQATWRDRLYSRRY
jgi:hypothetical protein